MMTPHAEGADDVAAAGRQAAEDYYAAMPGSPSLDGDMPGLVNMIANEMFTITIGKALCQGGRFDYQRDGNFIQGYTQSRQFRNISNFNVGLYAQQAGLSLQEVLHIAGTYARVRSGNAKPDKPYGLDDDTFNFISIGYRAGESGAYGSAVKRR